MMRSAVAVIAFLVRLCSSVMILPPGRADRPVGLLTALR
jgi:hypothetical protein